MFESLKHPERRNCFFFQWSPITGGLNGNNTHLSAMGWPGAPRGNVAGPLEVGVKG